MTPWVRRLLIANVAMFALQIFVPLVTYELEFVPALALMRPWTIVTYMFLHDPNSITHILFNMITLYFFGTRVEERLGERRFIVLYLLSGVGGAALSFFLAPNAGILGASGALMGVLMAYVLYWPRERIYIYGVLPVEAWLLVGFYVLWDLIGARSGGDNVAHFAHLGGFAIGFLYLKAIEMRAPARSWKKKVQPAAPKPVLFGDADLRRWREIRLDDLHPLNRAEVVRLLQKAQQQGTKSLTLEERATLDRFASGPGMVS